MESFLSVFKPIVISLTALDENETQKPVCQAQHTRTPTTVMGWNRVFTSEVKPRFPWFLLRLVPGNYTIGVKVDPVNWTEFRRCSYESVIRSDSWKRREKKLLSTSQLISLYEVVRWLMNRTLLSSLSSKTSNALGVESALTSSTIHLCSHHAL